ncbi:Ras-related protein Rab-6A [Sarcoptes scabiei]|nr:Ras-related protein Rab-6A [Sarcoptes scabiei]
MSLLLGKCISSAKQNLIKLLVPQMKFDSFLMKHFRENETILAYDQNNQSNPGDWVLLKKFDEEFRLGVHYSVEKVIYQSGNKIDPLTNKKSLGYETVEDFDHLRSFCEKFDRKEEKS